MAPKTVSVTVKYAKPGTQPPIYLAGSFSEPAWQPQEMLYTTNEINEHEFYKEVQVEEGHEYQYKFRVGEGDWWLLNEDSPTTIDDAGNRNNLLSVPVSEGPTAPQQNTSEHSTVLATEQRASHPITEMENTNAESIEGEKHAPNDTQGEENVKEVEPSKEPSELPIAEEHNIITPAHTNTPAEFATVEDTKEEDALSHARENEEVLKEFEHLKEDAKISSPENTDANPIPEIDDNAKAQIVADSIAPLHASEGSNAREEQKQATEASQTLAVPPGIVEPTSTPAPQGDEDSLKASEIISSPTLVVEKVDDELRHGDDFGSAATVAQKDAHSLRSQDAEPDYVVMRMESRTPEIAETAAEVSESAAMLDRDPPTPPISDGEAGRIGYRRMSSTPIPQVAKTAAEVADVAATLDEGTPALEVASNLIDLGDDDEEDLLNSGASTPASQRAPKFAYECLGPDDTDPPAPCQSQPVDPLEPVPSRYEEAVEIDWNDPSIEMFPTDRAAILERLKRLSERMPEDLTDVDVVPPSPIVGPNHHPERQLPPPSPAYIAHEISPSLDSITEENDELQETLVSLPEASKLVLPAAKNATPTLSGVLSDSAVVLNTEKPKLEIVEKGVEPEPAEVAANGPESVSEVSETGVKVEEPVPETKEEEVKSSEETQDAKVAEDSGKPEVLTPSDSKDENTTTEQPEQSRDIELLQGSREPEVSTVSESKHEKTFVEHPEEIPNVEPPREISEHEISAESQTKDEKTVSEQPTELPSVELPQGTGEPELTSNEEEVKGAIETTEDASVEVQEVGPETPPSAPVEQTLVDTPDEKPHAVPSPITPLVAGSRQLGHDDEDKVHEITTGSEGPNITVQPATPGPSITKTDFNLKPLDEAKSTAIEEENGRNQVKPRKQPKSQSPERPVTPTSMHSPSKDTKSKNFLKAFWRVVFVDWIGGLLRALCGGGRGGYTLLAVSVIVLVALAPTLYSSIIDSSRWE